MPRIDGVDNIGDKKHPMRQYILYCLQKIGKDFYHCEECGRNMKKQIHHKKYDGATIYDLAIVCQSCNLKAYNRNLA